MSLLDAYLACRQRSIELCAPLRTEDYVPQAAVFASPPKWNLGHTSWFFEEMLLKPFLKGYRAYDAAYSFLFNSYYNGLGERVAREQRGSITRPSVSEVIAYRKHVDQAMGELLAADLDPQVVALATLGIHHEQQHQELLLTDLKYTLYQNPLRPAYDPRGLRTSRQHGLTGSVRMDAGIYHIGHEGEGFCFDNELGRHRVFLEDFAIDQTLVTNGEFLRFIEAGGYEDFRYWHDEGWAWVGANQISAPLYWEQHGDHWRHFTLAGMQPLDMDDPVAHVSFYEAAAYASWSGRRLPTEFEWEAASRQLQWGRRWEWTQSAYLPYPGFKVGAGAVGEYNGKFMVNQLVLRGASEVTAAGHSRPSYRNFFHPDARWQFSGIRLAS